ncbi:MAG: GNAT family N-acetyltransferase [Dehalococcoidia bacterium]
MAHPEHDAVAAALLAAYEEPYEPMGWATERRPFGIYRQNTKAQTYPNVIVRSVSAAEVPDFLRDVRSYYAGSTLPARIMIDDREADATLGRVLVAAGVHLEERTVFLAHVGDVPAEREAPGVRIEVVGRGGLFEYEDTRRRAFDNTEEPTPPEDLAWRVDLRRAEMDGGAHHWIARADGQPAAMMGWYEGRDRMVFSLGTRMPFRNRGIARLMLTQLLAESREAGTRAVIISADEYDTPVRLYRRLGFTDELYWRATYELDLA